MAERLRVETGAEESAPDGFPVRASDAFPIDRSAEYEAEIRSLCTEVLERYEEATLVYRLCERLGSALGEDAIAQAVLDDAARVLGARSGEVWLSGDVALVLAASFPGDGPAGVALPDHGARTAIATGGPWIVETSPGVDGQVAVPLPGPSTEPIGALVLRGRTDGRAYRAGEVKLLTSLATLTSAFIRNARLVTEVRRAEARRREDEIARQIHLRLLPHSDPSFEGVEIRGGHRAADHVGGDYYGYIPMSDGSLGVAMADVSGHGVGAALYMAAAKGAVQSVARRILSPAEILRNANDMLVSDFSESDMFATAVYVRIHPGASVLDVCVAGHNPPILVRANGAVERFDRGGIALGVFERMAYDEERRGLEPGDVLVVYTDGLVEARDASRRALGIDRLAEISREVAGLDAAGIRARILAEMAAHCGGVPPADDVTLVVVKAVPRPREGGRA